MKWPRLFEFANVSRRSDVQKILCKWPRCALGALIRAISSGFVWLPHKYHQSAFVILWHMYISCTLQLVSPFSCQWVRVSACSHPFIHHISSPCLCTSLPVCVFPCLYLILCLSCEYLCWSQLEDLCTCISEISFKLVSLQLGGTSRSDPHRSPALYHGLASIMSSRPSFLFPGFLCFIFLMKLALLVISATVLGWRHMSSISTDLLRNLACQARFPQVPYTWFRTEKNSDKQQ